MDIDRAQLGAVEASAVDDDRGVAATVGTEDATVTAGAEVQTGQSYRASDLMNMDVRLSDEENFGSVEDILVNEQGEASAVVVTSWDFLDRQQYALPVDLQAVNVEEDVIQYDLSSQDVEQQGEFDFDDHLEST
jgi:ribosomal 30S subunit maturation factor RimM